MCGDSWNWLVDGAYTKQAAENGNVPYYKFQGHHPSYNPEIYWDFNRGSWTIGWSHNWSMGWYYLPRWNIEADPWFVSPNAKYYNFQDEAERSTYQRASITVSAAMTCNLPDLLWVCGASEWGIYGNEWGEPAAFYRTPDFQTGAPYYKYAHNDYSGRVIMWESSAWILTDHMGFKFAWYHIPSKNLLDPTESWKVSKMVPDYIPGEFWEDTTMFVSRNDACIRPTAQPTTTTLATTTNLPSTTSTDEWEVLITSTPEATTAFNHVSECPEKGTMVNWMGTGSILEFYGETSAVIRTNIFNNIGYGQLIFILLSQ